MRMPEFAAEASLQKAGRRYLGRPTAHPTDGNVLTPQAETCDYGYIEGRPGLWIVCCDIDRNPPCVAYGIV
jgi:hypothetical protein